MSYSHVYTSKNEPWRRRPSAYESFDSTFLTSSITALTYLLLLAAGAYYVLRRSDVLPPNTFQRFLWRCFVWSIPPSLVLALERRERSGMDAEDTEETYADTRTFGAKSEAIRRILGLDSSLYLDAFRAPRPLMRVAGLNTRSKNAALPGLFNRDNECYQNSIIQSFAALPSFSNFVHQLPSSISGSEQVPLKEALQDIIERLNNPNHRGNAFWTPWALKSMSSWQQQDAQEYFSRVIDELEKEAAKALRRAPRDNLSSGLASLKSTLSQTSPNTATPDTSLGGDSTYETQNLSSKRNGKVSEGFLSSLSNPLEGLIAQRVGCLRCSFVEGLSLIPFNCLTVSLGNVRYCDLETCLDSYTDLETISGVECARCTLLRQERMFTKALNVSAEDLENPNKQDYYSIARSRLQAVKTALENNDFSESTLAKQCKIPTKSRVTTDKTRQAVIARAPKALAIHINRSVFDESTGAQYKNFAAVHFPKLLNLHPWCLGSKSTTDPSQTEEWESNPSKSMVLGIFANDIDDVSEISEPVSTSASPDQQYALRAVITHYGTHGDGHYITYRQSPQAIAEGDSRTWWRLSDEEVVEVDENIVLNQGGVFMLFYERSEERSKDSVDAPLSQADITENQATISQTTSETAASAIPTPTTDEETTAISPEPGLGNNSKEISNVAFIIQQKEGHEESEDSGDTQQPAEIFEQNSPIDAPQSTDLNPGSQMYTATEVSNMEKVDIEGHAGIVPAV